MVRSADTLFGGLYDMPYHGWRMDSGSRTFLFVGKPADMKKAVAEIKEMRPGISVKTKKVF